MCDTFVARGEATSDGAMIFGKNSDREPNEAQVLEFHARRRNGAGESVRLTYLTIPQVAETRAVLLSRPFWMWGAEIGANEDGVVIGNEAVWTKMPLSRKPGITGMDMLRLALERSGTAAQALETIASLLSDYGQGGICGYQDKRMTYHNSFLIADPRDAWVLETAGPLWAARKVQETASISNGLSIGEDIDLVHPDLIDTARRKGWLKKGETFHFSRCYSDWFYTTFSACRRRRRRSLDLLQEKKGKVDASAAMAILRDHEAADYRPDGHFLGSRICAHAGNTLARKSTQTTASLVARLAPAGFELWATGTAAPCTSVFKPVWFGENVLPELGPAPAGRADAATLWWRHERFHRAILQDYPVRMAKFSLERDHLEREFIREAGEAAAAARFDVTGRAFSSADRKTGEWLDLIQGLPVNTRPRARFRSFWKKQNGAAGI